MTDPLGNVFYDADTTPSVVPDQVVHLGGTHLIEVDPIDIDFGAGEGPALDVRDNRGEDQTLPPGEVGEPIIRDYRLDFATGDHGVPDNVPSPEPGPDGDLTFGAQSEPNGSVFPSFDLDDSAYVDEPSPEVHDHRGEDQTFPPGEVGDGEPIVRDHRNGPLDDFEFDWSL